MKNKELIKCFKMMLEMFMRSLRNVNVFWKYLRSKAYKTDRKLKRKQ